MAVDRFRLDGKVAAVIGGTGVLGGHIASGFASAGAAVVVMGRRQAEGDERVRLIRDAGGTAVYVRCDAMDAASLAQAHRRIRDDCGEVAILLNAAGGNQANATVTADKPFQSIQLNDWHACVDLNLVGGVLLPCQEFGPRMVENGAGSIINIASVSSHLPLSRVVAYSAAKAAVLSLTKWLAREWATTGVRVNSISPGFFPAEQNRRMLFNEDGTPTERTKLILGHTPMGRFGDPDELIGAAVFLASDAASSFVTGSDLAVDGGFMATTL
ncbi:SDR family oxidoreductase [Candidatus Poribacteria bacterium]|nr:SDR family oxidoreductase [Candidatus Poribacteria bacterium]